MDFRKVSFQQQFFESIIGFYNFLQKNKIISSQSCLQVFDILYQINVFWQISKKIQNLIIGHF